MSDSAAPGFEAELARLTADLRTRLKSDCNPTPTRRGLEDLARRLRKMADEVESGTHWSRLEEASSEAHVQTTAWSMRELADSSERAASALPEPRRDLVLPWAADAYLRIRHAHGKGQPSLYGDGDDVQTFMQVLQQAGAPRDERTGRRLLSEALKAFDPFCEQPPPPPRKQRARPLGPDDWKDI
jgi:hypothetical protein